MATEAFNARGKVLYASKRAARRIAAAEDKDKKLKKIMDASYFF